MGGFRGDIHCLGILKPLETGNNMILVIGLYPFILFRHLVKHRVVLDDLVVLLRLLLKYLLVSILCGFSEVVAQIRAVFHILTQGRLVGHSPFRKDGLGFQF